MPKELPARLKEILQEFYNDMVETKKAVEVDSYGGTDDTYSDEHTSWADDDKEKAIKKIMNLLASELSSLKKQIREEIKEHSKVVEDGVASGLFKNDANIALRSVLTLAILKEEE